jgi:hypothetical protein
LSVVPSLARPGGNITGVRVDVGFEIYGKRLQIVKEALPSASKVAFLDLRTFSESYAGQQVREELRKASRLLQISLTDVLVEESTPSEYQRVFCAVSGHRHATPGRGSPGRSDGGERAKNVLSPPAFSRSWRGAPALTSRRCSVAHAAL